MKNLLGQSLFEVVIALAVISVVIVALINVTTVSIRNTSFARNNTVASRYAQEATEWLRGERDTSWTTFVGYGLTSVHCLDSLTWTNLGNCSSAEVIPNTPFTRQVTIACFSNGGTIVAGLCTNANVDTLQATVTVQWTDAQGSHTVSTPVQFTNWRSQ